KIYYSWEESAVDAINKIKKMYTPVYGDIETYYKFAEQYNGTGYSVYHDMNSPYVWSGTDKYDRGMYTSDGSFNPDYKDTRPGVAVLLDALGLS
ncbi:glycoside hydrolase, partial [bacterium]|nr:glycoside hydrolase [bacterium]